MDQVDQMTKAFSLSVIGIAVALVGAAYMGYAHSHDKPDYLQAAETRVSSYLTSDYGRVSCNSIQMQGQQWRLECHDKAKSKDFEYAVYPADQAPYAVSRAFYLEAVNDNAIQSASQGLMKYLQISTAANNVQS
jgi:hypothetical protein